ncbi:hypothetical protein QQS21_000689 [Conoideocrella luteorostrata]|uniref:Uncharacterized protein n=1 Tax=Conoideocrella luteorostrata TaxID=1105319 RepID=A0AAJ0G2F5_9HYPO|nr:hypothetical protein QQS21_000689 [Conoideocrella luteorostrata]
MTDLLTSMLVPKDQSVLSPAPYAPSAVPTPMLDARATSFSKAQSFSISPMFLGSDWVQYRDLVSATPWPSLYFPQSGVEYAAGPDV